MVKKDTKKIKADREDILNFLNRRLRKLKKRVDTFNFETDLTAYEELLDLKEDISKKDFNLRKINRGNLKYGIKR